MKINSFRNVVATVSVFAGLAAASSAHAIVINETLGAGAFSTDVFLVGCNASGTVRLTGNVADLPPSAAPLVNLQISKNGKATSTTDPGEGGAASPTVSLSQGVGVYQVLVNKTRVGAETYRIVLLCRKSSGNPIDPSVLKTQDQ